jgi:hypothetical protein
MDKAKIKGALNRLETFAKKLGNLLVLIIALFAGGVIGYYYHHFSKSKNSINIDDVRTIEATSVAINERGELLIIDRKSGKYSLYDDSVGTAIFGMYANKMYLRQNGVQINK